MGISRVSFTSQSIKANTDITIEMLESKPDTRAYLDTPVVPNVLCGFFNDATDSVELYITDSTGRRYIKVL